MPERLYIGLDPEASELGFEFYREAVRLWDARSRRHDITSVPAATILSFVASSFFDTTLAFSYLAQAVHVAKGLSLFRGQDLEMVSGVPMPVDGKGIDGRLLRARAAIAWGIFNWQT